MDSNISSKEFMHLQHFIEEHSGIHFEEEKAYLVESRLANILVDMGLTCFEELYLKILGGIETDVKDNIIDAVTINETFWFRDKTPWYVLEDIILPEAIKKLSDGKKTKVRIWSAACAYGQEAYSIAMCIDNYLTQRQITGVSLSDFEIVATDISKTALQMAATARFDNISIMRGLEESYKQKYFKNEGRFWSLNDKIRNAVIFKHFNLKYEFTAMGKFDVVFCRNVLIYFKESLKVEVMRKLALCIEPEGTLFIGSSELLPEGAGDFRMKQHRNGVYFVFKE